MIIRQLLLRQGRRTLTAQPVRSFQRFLSSEVNSIEASLQNCLKETHSIEAYINSASSTPVSPIDPDTHATAETGPVSDSVAKHYQIYKEQEQLIGKIGSTVSPHYQPHTLLTNPPSPSDVTLELLLASGAHQGHHTSLWNPNNARYIHGIRHGIHVISLDVTATHLRRAAKVVTEVTRRGGLVLFVGTRPGQDRCVVKAAQLAKGCHLFERWIPGSITNGQQILGRCRTKVVDEKDQEVPGFEEQLYERAVLKPDLVVCLNPMENYVLLHECGLNNIPTIGIIDTDADPNWVTYAIPANDDSLRCAQVIAGVLGRAGEQGQKLRLQAAEKGIITYTPAKDLKLSDQKEPKDESDDILEPKDIELLEKFLEEVNAEDANEGREVGDEGEQLDKQTDKHWGLGQNTRRDD